MKFLKKPTKNLLSRYDFHLAISFIKKNKNDMATVIYCTKHFIDYIKAFICNQITEASNISLLITSINQDLTLSLSSTAVKKTRQRKKVVKDIQERLNKKQNALFHEDNLFNVSFLEKEQNSMASVAGHLFNDKLGLNTSVINERLIAENEDFISRISLDNNNMSLNYDAPSREQHEVKNISASNSTGSRSFTKIDNSPLIKSSIIENLIKTRAGPKLRRPIINSVDKKELGGLSFIRTLSNCLSQIKKFVRHEEGPEDYSQEFQFDAQNFDEPEFVRKSGAKSISVCNLDENEAGYRFSGTDSSKMNTFTKTIDESPIKKTGHREDEKMQLYNLLKFQNEVLQGESQIEFHDILNVVYGQLSKGEVCQHFWSLLNLQHEGKVDCSMDNNEIMIELNVN